MPLLDLIATIPSGALEDSDSQYQHDSSEFQR